MREASMGKGFEGRGMVPLAFVLLFFIIPGCGNQEVKFNNRVARLSREMKRVRDDFLEALRGGDGAKIKAAHAGALSRVDALKAQADALTAPDTKEGKDFLDAFQEFMRNQQKIYLEEFREAAAIEEMERDERPRVEEILDRANQKTINDLNRLETAQNAFAQAHQIQIGTK